MRMIRSCRAICRRRIRPRLPPRTRRNWRASARAAANSDSVGAGHARPGRRDRSISRKQRRRGARRRDGRRPRPAGGGGHAARIVAHRPGMGKDMPISSAFCSPVEQSSAACPWGRGAPRSRCGADRPGFGRRPGRRRGRHAAIRPIGVLGLTAGPARPSSSMRPWTATLTQGNEPPKRAVGCPTSPARASSALTRAAASGHRRFRHLRLDGGEPARRRAAPSAQQAIALAHGALEAADAAGMGRVEARHQPVEKAAAVARGAVDEQPIHGRREPQHRDVLGKRAGPWGLAVDARPGAGSRAISPVPSRAGADIDGADAASRAVISAADRQARPAVAPSSRIGERAPRKPRPGASSEIASRRLVLPAPLGPVSTTGGPGFEPQRGIVAEVGEGQTASRTAAERCRPERCREASKR